MHGANMKTILVAWPLEVFTDYQKPAQATYATITVAMICVFWRIPGCGWLPWEVPDLRENNDCFTADEFGGETDRGVEFDSCSGDSGALQWRL